MINIELANRQLNQHTESVLSSHTPPEEQDNFKIDFECECSDPDCSQKVNMTLAEYDGLHRSRATFVLAKGHEEPKVDQVRKRLVRFTVVEKDALKA